MPADSLEMTLCGKKGRNQVNNYKINAFGKTDVGACRTGGRHAKPAAGTDRGKDTGSAEGVVTGLPVS